MQFGPREEDNFVQNVKTGKKILMVRKGGSYVIEANLHLPQSEFSRAGPHVEHGILAARPEGDLGSEDEEEEVEQEGFGAQRNWAEKSKDVVKTILDPQMPTVKEVEERNRTHLPYRNWCPHLRPGQGQRTLTTGRIRGAKGACPSSRSTAASQGMSWGTSSPCWSAGSESRA